MAHDVFKSYSNKDKPIADAICANLESAGVRCWIAPRDIVPGEDWPSAINKAITKSRVMVLVFSQNSNSSEDVSRELILAANSKLVIIPFKIDNIEPEPGKQYYLARTLWLDAMNPPTRSQIITLVETAKKMLTPDDSTGAPTPSPLPTTPKEIPEPEVKKSKPWRLWQALSSFVLFIAAIVVTGIYMKGRPLVAKRNSSTPIWATAAPALTQPSLSAPATTITGIDITAARPPTTSIAGNIQATPGKILDEQGDYVAWSPDGKWLVIGGREVHFYDTQSMRQVHAVQVKYGVEGLAISPDSKVLAVIDISNAVKLFDLASGSELQTLPRTDISTGAASSSFLAFTPDSTTLAVVLGDTVKLFNVATGQETGTIVAKGAMAILFSPDGQSLYSGSSLGIITVWNVASGAEIRSMGEPITEGKRLALSPDGSLLVSAGSFDKPMVLWDTATGRQLRTFAGHKGGVNSLAFSPDGKLLASSAGDVTIKLWDVASGNALQTLVGHTQAATSLAFSPDGARLASTAYNQGVWLWGFPTK